MIGRDVFLLEAAREATDDEVLTSFVEQYYARAGSIPREVVPARQAIADTAVVEAFLAERRGGPVHLRVPQRGEKRELLALATRNAAETLAREQARWLADQGKTLAALEELAEALGLPGPPLRIECYDISNFQGSESVGSMVVFEDGKPRTGEYRRFRIKTVQGPNDFASHQEVLRRRFRSRPRPARRASRRRAAGRCPTSSSSTAARARSARRRRSSTSSACTTCRWPAWPRSARSCSCPDRTDPILLPATSPALYLVQRLRDEAHRFAITYHRDLRARRTVRSAFDDLPGVGPKRKRELLKVFGSIKRVRDAPVEQIAAVPGHRPRARGADQGDARGLTCRPTAR